MGYNGNGGHIIYGRLTWKGVGQMSEDERGQREWALSRGQVENNMAGEETVEKATRQEGGPTSIPHHSIPPPPPPPH
jgi:hypothetical protein